MIRSRSFALGSALIFLLAGGLNFASYLSGQNDPWKIVGGAVFSLLGIMAIVRASRTTG